MEFCKKKPKVLCFGFCRYYGLKWTGHVTLFGQSDCPFSKTRNPSDNKKLNIPALRGHCNPQHAPSKSCSFFENF